MRVGKNEKAILLFLASVDREVRIETIHQKFFYTLGYRDIPIQISPSQISQSLTSLQKKGFVHYRPWRGFVSLAEATDEGRKVALRYKEEIKRFIEEWSQFVK